MKQAIIYARARNSNTLKDQITVCKLFATRNGFQIIRVICQTGSFPSVRKLTRIPIDNIIIASLPYWDPRVFPVEAHEVQPRRQAYHYRNKGGVCMKLAVANSFYGHY